MLCVLLVCMHVFATSKITFTFHALRDSAQASAAAAARDARDVCSLQYSKKYLKHICHNHLRAIDVHNVIWYCVRVFYSFVVFFFNCLFRSFIPFILFVVLAHHFLINLGFSRIIDKVIEFRWTQYILLVCISMVQEGSLLVNVVVIFTIPSRFLFSILHLNPFCVVIEWILLNEFAVRAPWTNLQSFTATMNVDIVCVGGRQSRYMAFYVVWSNRAIISP